MKSKRITRSRRAALGALAAITLMLGVEVSSQAQEAAAPTPGEVGHSTRAWLDLQRSNASAAPAQPMLGAEASLAYNRYLESFKTKIPEMYGSSLSQGGAAGGASGGGGGSASPQN